MNLLLSDVSQLMRSASQVFGVAMYPTSVSPGWNWILHPVMQPYLLVRVHDPCTRIATLQHRSRAVRARSSASSLQNHTALAKRYTMVNITSNSFHPASLSFGGGLVDIAALTAIIGSTTAKSLILGNRGAPGLVWGTMSFFGTLVVIKACIAAAMPGWLRETIGVKNEETDAALSSVLTLSDKSLQSRQRAIGVCGILCKISLVRVKFWFQRRCSKEERTLLA